MSAEFFFDPEEFVEELWQLVDIRECYAIEQIATAHFYEQLDYELSVSRLSPEQKQAVLDHLGVDFDHVRRSIAYGHQVLDQIEKKGV